MEVTIGIEDEMEVNVMHLKDIGTIKVEDLGVMMFNGVTCRQIVIGPVEINLFQERG